MSKRNEFVDVMRGVAILLVVLGHTMTGCTANSESSFLYNVIWSIQMPLFFLISGYVTKYSKSIKTTSDLCNYIKRRTIAYMWPWLIWSFLVRGIILGQSYFLTVKFLFWHMDTGYWFLASIWTISIAFGISSFFAEKSNDKSDSKYMIRMLIFYLLCMVALLGIGLSTGLSFFAIKQTLYYMPFYFAGFLWGRYQDNIMSIKWGKSCISILVALCLGVWLYIMVRYNIYALPDSGMAIIFRAITSLCGCVALCGLCKGIYKSSTAFGGGVRWCGVHSLELYLSHYLFLNQVTMELEAAGNALSTLMITINYVITVTLTVLTVIIVIKNSILQRILFCMK